MVENDGITPGLYVHFITDGTKYHDGDVEEVYGVFVTPAPKHEVILEVHKAPRGDMKKLKYRLKKFPGRFIRLDWKNETNVIGMVE